MPIDNNTASGSIGLTRTQDQLSMTNEWIARVLRDVLEKGNPAQVEFAEELTDFFEILPLDPNLKYEKFISGIDKDTKELVIIAIEN